MKVPNSPIHYPPSRSFRSWIAGIFLGLACILYMISLCHIRWSIFPYKLDHVKVIYTGLWFRRLTYDGRPLLVWIRCSTEGVSCTTLIIARICLIIACIKSLLGTICLCIQPIMKRKYKSILYLIGLATASLSFIFGTIGLLSGLSWINQFDFDTIGSAAICALLGALFSLVSAICAFYINSKELS